MTTQTTNDAVKDTDEPKSTRRCSQVVHLDEPEPPTTARFQNWRTRWSADLPEHEAVQYLLVEYLLAGVLCLPAIVFLVELYLYIEWLLS
jgi:hypothetical protein